MRWVDDVAAFALFLGFQLAVTTAETALRTMGLAAIGTGPGPHGDSLAAAEDFPSWTLIDVKGRIAVKSFRFPNVPGRKHRIDTSVIRDSVQVVGLFRAPGRPPERFACHR